MGLYGTSCFWLAVPVDGGSGVWVGSWKLQSLLQIVQLPQCVGVAECLSIARAVKNGFSAGVLAGPGIYLSAATGDEVLQAGGKLLAQQAKHGLGAQLGQLAWLGALGVQAMGNDDVCLPPRCQHARCQIQRKERGVAGDAEQPLGLAMCKPCHEAGQRPGVVGQRVAADRGRKRQAQCCILLGIAVGIDEQGADLGCQALQGMQRQWAALKELKAFVYATHAGCAPASQHAAGDLLGENQGIHHNVLATDVAHLDAAPMGGWAGVRREFAAQL